MQNDELKYKLNFNNGNENNPQLKTKLSCIKSTDSAPAVKFLGLYLDSNLDFKYHIKCVHDKITRSLYTLKCMKLNCMSWTSRQKVFHFQ